MLLTTCIVLGGLWLLTQRRAPPLERYWPKADPLTPEHAARLAAWRAIPRPRKPAPLSAWIGKP